MEEMEKMKKGFERKIAILTEDFSTRERELRKKEAEYKSENEKIKWEKSLLLKKFELIPQKWSWWSHNYRYYTVLIVVIVYKDHELKSLE